MSEPFRLLISGNGITGPVVAYWLAQASTLRPIHITIVERASSLLTSGQGIEVEGPAKELAIRMGLLETIKSKTTNEAGSQGIDKFGRPYVTFIGGGITQELEIMRGTLCAVLTKAVEDNRNVKVQYNRHIVKLENLKDTVRVTINNDGHSYEEEYDAVIASEGVRSKTRGLMLGAMDTKDCIKPKQFLIAYFSVPSQPQDAPYARWQHFIGRRSVCIRPVTKDTSSIYLMAVGKHPAITDALKTRKEDAIRQAWSDAFHDAKDGEFPRIMREMLKTDNFYSDEVSQVKLPRWSQGRCVVVGDAAYGPSPLTGSGTQLAFLGAYVLAGELGKNLDDPASAFQEYEKKLRAHVESVQQIPLGGWAPFLAMPQSALGIWILQSALWLINATKISRLFPDGDDESFKLPEYSFRK